MLDTSVKEGQKWRMSIPQTLFDFVVRQEAKLHNSVHHKGEVHVNCQLLLIMSFGKISSERLL